MKDTALWSRHFAELVARTLGFPAGESSPDGGENALRQAGESLLDEVTEAFRYLPPAQLRAAQNLARFLRAEEEEGRTETPPFGWAVRKLRDVRDYAQFLRGRYGLALPADESGEWNTEDEQDCTAAARRRLDEEDPTPGTEDAADAPTR